MLENPEWMPPPAGEREAANEANAAAEEAEEARMLIEAEEQRIEEERARAAEERSQMEAEVMRLADEEFDRRMAEEEAQKEEAAVALAALGPDEQRAHLLSKMTANERELFEGPGLAAMLDQQTLRDMGILGAGGDLVSLENSGSQSKGDSDSHYKLWYKTHGQHVGGDSIEGDSLTEGSAIVDFIPTNPDDGPGPEIPALKTGDVDPTTGRPRTPTTPGGTPIPITPTTPGGTKIETADMTNVEAFAFLEEKYPGVLEPKVCRLLVVGKYLV